MQQIITALALGVLLALSAAGVAAESGVAIPPNACAVDIERKLTELAVNRADIDKISISPRYENRDDETNRVLGLDAWVRFKSCAGSLIIDMERDCRLRQVYTRGRCTLPGLKSFWAQAPTVFAGEAAEAGVLGR